ncbi:MAG: hypothetical protein LUD17_10345 [Bacteroidales bacterium]|nr:hypothetical protein [Bacteroidales bacterium]
MKESVKLGITLQARGGLANRLRAIASAVSLGQQTGVPVKIGWRLNWELNGRLEDLFEPVTNLDIHYPGALKFNMVYEMPRKKNLYFSALSQRIGWKHILEDPKLDEHELESLVKDGKVFIGCGSTFYPFDGDLYRSLFKPNAAVQRVINEFKERLGNDPYYSFHIRRTDNTSAIANSPIELFKNKIIEIQQADPKAKIFLATDSQGVKDEFGHQFGPAEIFNPRPSARDTLAGMIDATDELWTLANAAQTYGSYWSSYTDAAPLINPKNRLQVLAQ